MDEAMAVGVVRHNGKIRWFRMNRDNWILDWQKWRDEFVKAGLDVPPLDASGRFGISIVNENTVEEFIRAASDFELTEGELRSELLQRFQDAKSWWDVSDLFPIVFVDFDSKSYGAFYFSGAKMERYIPNGWRGEFVDFAKNYDEIVFPSSSKFWISGDLNMLDEINKRGEGLEKA
ncbi:hypothetical protein [Ralstonia solanacearum]|uniref:hypothetical protein n=1 Tax=Ralstonia solanacearum TaxID=305 RepID=UPI001E46F9A7|nr:hypothetical protein [Ralstonia solanacearum]